eukprot:3912345-Pleurochrysis_carterae.AAC.1
MLLAPLEHAASFVQRGYRSFESSDVLIFVVRPHVLERDVADASFGAAGIGRAAVRGLLRFGFIALACWIEPGVLPFVLRA